MALENRLAYGWRAAPPLSDEDRLRIERLLGGVRVFLSLVGLAVLRLDPPDSGVLPQVSGILSGYAAFAAVTALVLRAAPQQMRAISGAAHIADIALAAVVAFARPQNGASLVFFVFVMLGAALRWGFAGTLKTGVAALLCYAGLELLFDPDFDAAAVVLRSAHFAVATVVLALLGGTFAAAYTQQHVVSALLRRVRAGGRFRQGVESVVEECWRISRPRSALLALASSDGEGDYLWTFERRSAVRSAGPELVPSSSADHEMFFRTPLPNAAAWTLRIAPPAPPQARVLAGSRMVAVGTMPASVRLLERYGAASYICLRTRVAGWSASLFLLDPGYQSDTDLRLLRRLLDEVAPTLHAQYSGTRLRARINEAARASFARELHDRVLQSLIAVEMQLEAVRRIGEQARPVPPSRIESIREHLHEAILEARDLMGEMRTAPTRAGTLRQVSRLVERFRIEAGIDAHFSSDVTEIDCSPQEGLELARIVQEALANVRKHSGARHVRVTVSGLAQAWMVSVEDDGAGFSFSGAYTHEDLDRYGVGPAVIKERVRALGAQLRLYSRPGHGVRLEIRLPRRPVGRAGGVKITRREE